MRRRMGAGGLQELKRADQIGLEVVARRLDGMAHPGLGCEMDHRIGLVGVKQPHQATGVFQLADHRREARVVRQHRMAAFFQGDVIIGGQTIKPHNLPACGQKPGREMVADEAGRAGDESGLHGS